MLIHRRVIALALFAATAMPAVAAGATEQKSAPRATSPSRSAPTRRDYVTRTVWASDARQPSAYRTPQRGRPVGGVPGSPGNLPAGRRYYGGRYFGNFNNRIYGPQYGYF